MIHILQPLPVDSLRLYVFDMDGTLVDSRLDLCNSVNAMLTHLDIQTLPEEVISTYIGDGAAMLVRRALGDPDDEDYVQQALLYFLTWYRAHKLDNTQAYPGVMDSLALIHAHAERTGGKLAVLTNKPVGPSVAICDALGISPYLIQNYGGDSFHTKKPNPHAMRTLMAEAGAEPQQTVMIGDSDVDVLTARNAGVWSLGCTFGLAPERLAHAHPDVTVDHASEWPEALGIPASI
jgi:phosphoglycolate phosphatase